MNIIHTMDRNDYFTEEKIQEMIEWLDDLDILNTHPVTILNVADYLMLKKAGSYISNFVKYLNHEKEN